MGLQGSRLAAAVDSMDVVDAHEHLWPESYHLAHEQDVLTLLQYSLADLEVAGASPAEIDALRAHREGAQAPLDARWAIFRRYLPAIEDTAPVRALFRALRDIHGIDGLDDNNYVQASEKIRTLRRPGIYAHLLRERCRIRLVLNQNPEVLASDGFLLPIRNLHDLGTYTSIEGLQAIADRTGVTVRSLDDAPAAMAADFDRWQADGTVGVKRSGTDLPVPSEEAAAGALARVREGKATPGQCHDLCCFVEEHFIAEAGRRGWPVCVHTGLWAGTWADMRLAHPERLIPIAMRHRQVRFDVYHAGIPWTSTVGIMGRQLPNLWLNLCWSHVISPVMARRTLDEWLDVVPATKIIGWGGDYWMALEKVYGHLCMAKENIVEVLSGRVERGLMSQDRAERVAQMMLRDNPASLYGLSL